MTSATAILIALLLCVVILVALTALGNHIGKTLGAAFEKQFSKLLSDVFRRLAIEVAETTASFDRRRDAHAFVRQRQNDLEIVFTQDGNQVVIDRLSCPMYSESCAFRPMVGNWLS
ncbi:MAG: hypothetical protein NZ556_00520 [Fimbriimonadales bacterium]|nr:hypothetical protein [Fimbriimonadales bacterium]